MTGSAVSGHRHAQLHRLHTAVLDRACATLCLDVFDTVLWRRVPRPTDLFGLLGARLRDDGRCPSWVTDATFRQLRIDAERAARAQGDALGGEVSLTEIWRAMPLSLFRDTTLDELIRAEVDLERAMTEVDLDIAAVARLARRGGIPLALVSDTYFSREQLAQLLDRPELDALRGARIFRSQEYGADKSSGLWDIVARELGHSPERILHVGDHETADHEIPGKLGIRTVHYRRLDEDFSRMLEREQEPVNALGPTVTGLDQEHGDFGLTSMRAKVLQTGGRTTSSATGTAWRFGAAVLGPVLTGFAEWVALRAHAAGLRTVWCPMREGELLSELVNNAADARGLAVVAKPVWLSRHVASLAALDCTSRRAVQEFIRGRHLLTVRQLLEVLHLRAGEIPHLAAELDTLLDNRQVAAQLGVALTETPHLLNRLRVTTTAARERLLKALRDAGALAGSELPLVDLGWGGTIQLHLARVLRIAGTGTTTTGFYLATDARSARLYSAGLRAEGYLGQAGHPREIVGVLARSPEVVEQSVNALCGSLVDFTDDGSPVLAPVTATTSQNRERRSVQEGVLTFQRYWNRQVRTATDWPTLTGAARPRLANILTAALKTPTTDEATLFGNWRHEDNFGSTVVTRILPDDLAPAIPYLSPADLGDLGMRDSFWPGLLAASDPHLAAAARAISAGAIEPAAFEPAGEPSATTLRYRTADGEWHDGSSRRVRINHNGLSFARMDLQTSGATHVSLAVPGRPALVRVDWIEAATVTGGRHEVLRWQTPADFAGLTFVDCAWLGANLIEFHSPLAAVWLPLSAEHGAPATSVRITAGFAMLPRSRSGLGYRFTPAGPITRLGAIAEHVHRSRGIAGLLRFAARALLRRIARVR
ncbi:HAD family hydrolase [Amycolatopsis nigrescens]|uniref:HAD family hydrolase n=1 Tax=Amycolatopsis nigrescens TaxID=381445 RepID=UPI0003816884|nr:hypothetical protein [Amycolatopsis nigrescens]